MSKQDNAFRDFEHEGWPDDAICQNYHDYFGALTQQAVPPVLQATQVGAGHLCWIWLQVRAMWLVRRFSWAQRPLVLIFPPPRSN